MERDENIYWKRRKRLKLMGEEENIKTWGRREKL